MHLLQFIAFLNIIFLQEKLNKEIMKYEFIDINQIIYSSPIHLLILIIFSTSLVSTSYYLNNKIKIFEGLILNNVIIYSLIIIFIATSINIIYSFNTKFHLTIYFFGYTISLFGIFHLFYLAYNINIKILKNYKIIIIKKYLIIFIILILFLLISLSPVTDIDSLDYHLGAPLEWFRNKSFFARYDWFHYRLAGLGENLSLYGLYFGLENFSQLIQYSGLIIIILISKQYLKEKNTYIFYIAILSSPVLLFLISTQKFLLFPSSLIFVSYLLLTEERGGHFRKLLISNALILFAIGCKITFIFISVPLLIYSFYLSIKSGKFLKLLIFTTLLFLLINFPSYVNNFRFYGDPISPSLEGFKNNPNIAIINFSNMIMSFRYDLSQFIIPIRLGDISTIIGAGILILLFINYTKVKKNIIIQLLILAVTFIFYRYFFNAAPRFFFEFYIILIYLCVKDYESLYFKKVLIFILTAQLLFNSLFALYGSATLFKGSLSEKNKHTVKSESAEGYDVAKWIDETIPKETIIAVEGYKRFNALMPRKSISWEYMYHSKEKNLIKYLYDNKVEFIIHNQQSHIKKIIEKCINKNYDKNIKTFSYKYRNPLNKIDSKHNLEISLLKYTKRCLKGI